MAGRNRRNGVPAPGGVSGPRPLAVAPEAVPAPAVRAVAGFPPVPRGPSAADRARLARDRRLAGEAAPPRRSECATWPDPADMATGRAAKTVRGRMRGVGVVARLHRRNSPEITPEHVEAAHRLALAWAGATIGYSPRPTVSERTATGLPGPSHGPGAAALHQAADAGLVARALRAVGSAAIPLVKFVLIDGHDIASWTATRTAATGRKHCAKASMGRLLAALDHLVVAMDVPSATPPRRP